MGLIIPKFGYIAKRIEVSESNGKKIETLYNADGQVIKRTSFVDRNKDGKYDLSEAVSIKFYDVNSKSANTREYRDLDNDGNYDIVIEKDWTGFSKTKKYNESGKSDNYKMSDVYGEKGNTIDEWFKSNKI